MSSGGSPSCVEYDATVAEITGMSCAYLTMTKTLKSESQTLSKDSENLTCCAA